MGWRINVYDGVTHIFPENDLQEHEETTTCECEPRIEFDNGQMMVVHSSFDGRECMEEVNEILKQ